MKLKLVTLYPRKGSAGDARILANREGGYTSIAVSKKTKQLLEDLARSLEEEQRAYYPEEPVRKLSMEYLLAMIGNGRAYCWLTATGTARQKMEAELHAIAISVRGNRSRPRA